MPPVDGWTEEELRVYANYVDRFCKPITAEEVGLSTATATYKVKHGHDNLPL